MNSIKSLNNRMCKIEASIPPKTPVRQTDASLFTEQEREQLIAFSDSLPRPLDLRTLNEGQLNERKHWLFLEKALSEGNMAEAEKLRRRYSTSLEQLVDMFLSLDISSIPEGKVIVDAGACYSHTSHRNIRINYIETGKAQERINDIWRWVEYFSPSKLSN
jgi:hypothetical protein